ncbi:MAG TPA: SusC/RagA family TonB-linked outer membrane protein, partial [Flavisolibacter sp.]|nr:SusC/RagA family TonB-linked outer membrane protein [Flavisolibacter sp.]
MKKNGCRYPIGIPTPVIKCLLMIKFTILLICFFSLQTFANNGLGQERVTLNLENASLKKAFKAIESQTDYRFVYTDDVLPRGQKITIRADEEFLATVLHRMLESTDLSFKLLSSKLIVVSSKNAASALAHDITGKITDGTGNALLGVSVVEKGTTNGTTTNSEGNFTLSIANEKAVLVISYIGFVTQEVSVNGRPNISVQLTEENKALSDVVVIGYGTQRKSDLTGSVASVKEEQIRERAAPSLNQALAGRMPGVQVNVNSGRPGGRSNIRIRGFSSINTSNNPLFVVDGVAFSQSNLAQFSSPIDFINPNDIVSVEVLKDASSTAIYGARGANGVIMVTTRKGRSGESRVTYNADFGVPTIGPNRPEVLNAKEYLAVEELAYKNMEKYDPVGWSRGNYAQFNPAVRRANAALRANGVFDANGNPLHNTDWLEAATQSKLSQNHQLGFSGGNDRTTYALSLGYRDDQGFIINSFMKRYSGRFTVEDQVKKWLRIGGTLSYNNQAENLVDIGNNIRQIVEDLPFLPVKYPDGTFANNRDYPGAEATFSSVHRLSNTKFNLNTQTTNGSFFTNINLFKGLEMRTVFGSNIIRQETNEFTARTIDIGNRGNAATRNQVETFWSLENYLTYNKRFKNSSLTALLGVSWQENNGHNSRASAQGFDTDFYEFNNLGPGSGARGVSSGSDDTDFGFESYFGRVNYNLFERYLFTVTGRADGSSRFGPNNKFAYFPSAAFAWRVSEEGFWKKNDLISNLKLRSSYGITGNSEIRSYEYLDLLGNNAAILNEVRVPGTGLGRLANPDLRWEKTAQADFGLELGLLNNRITLEADYYYRKTTDMLLSAPVPRTSGYANVRKNIGSMSNRGVELAINSTNISGKDFSWVTSFNISFNRNKILSLATPADIVDVGGPNLTGVTNIIRVGEAAGSYYGLTRLGVWGTHESAEAGKFASYRGGGKILPGDIKYLDVNGDYIINDADRGI